MPRVPPLPRAALLVALAAACGGDPTSTGPAPSGSLRFAYRGEASGSAVGSFAAEGARKQYLDGPAGAGASRFGDEHSPPFVTVYASREAGHPNYEEFELTLYGLDAAGAFPVCDPSDPEPTHCVIHGAFLPDPLSLHFFVAGTVTVTELTAARVRGTFEVVTVGSCSGCANPGASNDTIAVSGGVFDVPFR